MKVLVVDDEPLARRRLVDLLSETERYEVVGEAQDGPAAVRACAQLQPDAVLLDIRMPGMDGIEVARHLDSMENPPAVVFCTAFDQYAMSAFDVHAVGYLLKPVRRAALLDALDGARRTNRAQISALETGLAPERDGARSHLSVRSHRGIDLIAIEDVFYFMADQKYVRIRHRGGEMLTDEPLKDLENEFSDRFLRVHRNALVSRRLLDGLERNRAGHFQVRFKDVEERVPVSRRCVPEIKKLLLEL